MKTPFNWNCPYCGRATTITSHNHGISRASIETEASKYGDIDLRVTATACPNEECRGLVLDAELVRGKYVGNSYQITERLQQFPLLPESYAKPQPDYVPRDIRETYQEACAILRLSPKASAALSRRCLQGIVRDFWSIPDNKRGNLGTELSFIKDQIDPELFQAIQDMRSVGDIGAHMDKYVDQIVDVEPEEAELLIDLIENLLEDWYVAREKKKNQNASLRAVAQEKLAAMKKAKEDRTK